MTGQKDKSAEVTISGLLNNIELVDFNTACQNHIDYNKTILTEALGLTDGDVADAPVLFFDAEGRALAYFPDMVNHLVINDFNIIPRPYGPKTDGYDVFEKMMIDCLPEGRQIRFIDDWYSCFEMSGDVHCGTNTLREPFTDKKWWEYMPDGGFDI